MSYSVYYQTVLVTDENFNERAYLLANPDVARAIRNGTIESAYAHFQAVGRREKRSMRVKVIVPRKQPADRPTHGKLPATFPGNAPSTPYQRLLDAIMRLLGGIHRRPPARMENEDRRNEDVGGPASDERAYLTDYRLGRDRFIEQYITKGRGIEIGALHDPVPVPSDVDVQYVDRLSVKALRTHYPELDAFDLVEVDIVTDGEGLTPIKSGSQDFVIANHFLEHCQNPIRALENMLRVLRRDGVLFMAIPDKRRSFDSERPVTPYAHLERDYDEGPVWSERSHYEEWVRLVTKVNDEAEVARRVNHLMARSYSIHFHVWTQRELLELLVKVRDLFSFEVELFYRNIVELIVVLRKA